MDEAAIQQQQEIYKVQGVDEAAPALNPAKKRKEAQSDDVSAGTMSRHTGHLTTRDVALAPVPLTQRRRRTGPRAPKPPPRAMPEPLPSRMPLLLPDRPARTPLCS